MGAEIEFYPDGEDEAGADAALEDEGGRASGGRSVAPISSICPRHTRRLALLAMSMPATEILGQRDDFDFFVVASGSGATHAGLLAGLRGGGSQARVIGSCVRRGADLQGRRIERVMKRLGALYPAASDVTAGDVRVWDGALAPGYGQIGESSLGAIRMMASTEGLFLDPVYTAKSFAAVPSLVESGDIPQASKVCFVHTGGLAALYAYEDQISAMLGHATG
jgi:1-aminocyclopropane-1-carboxylate deaminase/D-cysteine desulfhydrase-like pyridoxal-dependent ACC family enzyme